MKIDVLSMALNSVMQSLKPNPILTACLTAVFLYTVSVFGKGEERYEIRGRIVPPLAATVILHGNTVPFQMIVQTGPNGKFRFRKVPPDVYEISIRHPRHEEHRSSVHVGAKTADAKGRIEVLLKMKPERSAPETMTTVNVKNLAIPDKAWKEYQRVQNCLTKNDSACAIAHLENAVKIAPQFTVAWNHLGTIAHQSQRYPEALQYFQKARETDPEAYYPLVNMGGTLIHLNRLEEARQCNEQAVSLRPDDPLAHSQLGLTYMALGRNEPALKNLLQAERLDPSYFTQPQLWLAEIYMRQGKRKMAIEKLEDFLRYHPNSPDVPKFQSVLAKLKAEAKQD